MAEAFLLPPHLKLFWTGLLIYAISFVLFATGGHAGDGRMLGFMCAFFAFVLPINEATLALFHNVPLSIPPVPYVSLIIAGWINPIFLVTAFLILTGLHQRLVAVLKVAVVLMLPLRGYSLQPFACSTLAKGISCGPLVFCWSCFRTGLHAVKQARLWIKFRQTCSAGR